MCSHSPCKINSVDDRSLYAADSQGKHYGSIRLNSPEKNEQNIQRQMAWKGSQWLYLYYVSSTYFMERYAQHILNWHDHILRGSNAVIPCFVLPAIRFYNKENEFSALATRTIPKTINSTKNIISSGIPLVPESYKRDILCIQKTHAIK